VDTLGTADAARRRMTYSRFTSSCLCLVLAGCGTVRSTLLPLALEPPIPESHGGGEVHVRETTLTGLSRSREPATSALYLPRSQLDGGGSVRLGRFFTLRFHGGSAIDAGALAAGSSDDAAPGRAAWYVGASPTFTFRFDHGRTQLAIGPDVTAAFVPYVWDDRYECGTVEAPATCGGVSDATWVAIMIGSSFSASHWLADWIRIGGSFGVRAQPTLDSAFAEEDEAPTSLGYVAFAVQAEVRFQIIDELGIGIESQWIAPVGPYVLYPTVGATIYGTFGDGPDEDPRDPDTWTIGP
jgi:hypothetical protein